MSRGRPVELDLDPILADWLEETAGAHRPDYLAAVLARTQRTRQRPAWTFASRWLPDAGWRVPVMVPRLAWQLLLLGLLLALLGAVALVGAAWRGTTPMGPGRPGLIAFDTGHRIAVMSADGGSFRLLTSGSTTDAGPAWSPDGQHLAFWRANGSGHWMIVVMSGDGAQQALIAVEATTPLPYPSGDPRWSTLAFDLDMPSPLAWSPDSHQIAFAQRVGGVFGIWVVEADGSGLRRLTDPALPARDPEWSPGGSRIAFRGGLAGIVTEGIWVMAGDGRDPHRVSSVASTGEAFRYPQWEPAGERIAFVALPDGKAHVFVVRADGTGERDLSAVSADSTTDDWLPTWSPDGSQIACIRVTADRPNGELLIMDPDSGLGLVPPGQPDRLLGLPMWSPDGRSITLLVSDLASGIPDEMLLLDLAGGGSPATFLIAGNAGETSWQRLPR